MNELQGIHHITCIAGDPQRNLDFYTGVLGMRLVKCSVNQDDPGTYHLFYADHDGHPGTDLTFFPWPHLSRGQRGAGQAVEVSLAVPPGSLDFWQEHLALQDLEPGPRETRRGAAALPLSDPDGLALALTETADERPFTPWSDGPIPAEHQVRGLHGVRLWERDLQRTATFLTEVMGFAAAEGDEDAEDGWHRFTLAGGGSRRWVEIRELTEARRGNLGSGSVHHVAWQSPHDAEQQAVRSRVLAAGAHPTEVIDRFWFRSVYFREPGGVLFELATDDPGFTADEALESLGQELILPPWLEGRRQEIEAALPPLRR